MRIQHAFCLAILFTLLFLGSHLNILGQAAVPVTSRLKRSKVTVPMTSRHKENRKKARRSLRNIPKSSRPRARKNV